MDDQQNPMKKFTVGAMLLQVVVLLGFTALTYYDSLALSGSPRDSFGFAPEVIAQVASFFFGVLTLIAIWLTGEHYEGLLKIHSLRKWAHVVIGLSVFPFIVFFGIFITNLSFLSLILFLQALLFLIPPTLVLYFLRKYRQNELVP